jgi:hypothetical protein
MLLQPCDEARCIGTAVASDEVADFNQITFGMSREP